MNPAQQILGNLGVPVGAGQKQAHGARNANATKAGPGRYHADGLKDAKTPKQRGAGSAFALHAASPEKRARRALVKSMGRRWTLRSEKRERAWDKSLAAINVSPEQAFEFAEA